MVPNNDITVPEILVGGNPTYYYQKYDMNTHKYILIARAGTSVNASISVKSSGVSIGDTISFTMSGLACYEGAYVNPPEQVPLSLDVQPTNQFALDTIDQPQGFFNTALKTSLLTHLGWHRIFRMREIVSYENYVLQGSLRLIKAYNEGGYHAYNIDFAMFGNYTYLKATLCATVPSNTYATKFRLAQDPNDSSRHVYVEMYHSKEYSSGNTWRVYVKDLEDYFSLLKSNKESRELQIRNNVLSDIKNPEFGILSNVLYNSDTSLREVNTEILTSANS